MALEIEWWQAIVAFPALSPHMEHSSYTEKTPEGSDRLSSLW